MTNDQLRAIATRVLEPLDEWAGQCHAASLKLVQSGELGECRVARGTCEGVSAQHSWVVLGHDCYDPDATIVDPTLWSYDDRDLPEVVVGQNLQHHRPHGLGSIWQWGRPDPASGPVVELTPTEPFSPSAQTFLEMLGPMDEEGWRILAHAPVQGWPAGEILAAIDNTPGLKCFVPIDVLGMITDMNPQGLYLRREESNDGHSA